MLIILIKCVKMCKKVFLCFTATASFHLSMLQFCRERRITSMTIGTGIFFISSAALEIWAELVIFVLFLGRLEVKDGADRFIGDRFACCLARLISEDLAQRFKSRVSVIVSAKYENMFDLLNKKVGTHIKTNIICYLKMDKKLIFNVFWILFSSKGGNRFGRFCDNLTSKGIMEAVNWCLCLAICTMQLKQALIQTNEELK